MKEAISYRGVFDPKEKRPYKLSRSGIELFIECPRCFYLEKRLGVKRPDGYPMALNIAVDALLKKEFDLHRAKKSTHPLMKAYGLKAVPFAHEDMDRWRHNFTGVQYLHTPTNMLITGAVDDIWCDAHGCLMVVDYKATSTESVITLDAAYRAGYKRQMEIYQWLLRKIGHKVSDTGYFVFCNGRKDRKAFDGKLEFDVQILPYRGDDSWIEAMIMKSYECLKGKRIPAASATCEYCGYRAEARKWEEKNNERKFGKRM